MLNPQAHRQAAGDTARHLGVNLKAIGLGRLKYL